MGETVYNNLVNHFITDNYLYADSVKLEEWMLYGSSRLGSHRVNKPIAVITYTGAYSDVELVYEAPLPATLTDFIMVRGNKRYELGNHLGNVLAVVSDKKVPVYTENPLHSSDFTSDLNGWTPGWSGVGQGYSAPYTTVSLDAGRFKSTATQAYGGARLIINTTPSKVYTVTFDFDIGTTGGVYLFARSGTSYTSYSGLYSGALYGSLSNYSYPFTATTSQTQVLFEKAGGGGTSQVFYLDNMKISEQGSETFAYYDAEIMQLTDYAPFGAPLPGRTYNALEDLNKVEIANQTFASGTDSWSTANSNTTVANSSGQLRLQTTNTASVSMSKTYTTTSGKNYRIGFDMDAATYTNVSVEIIGYGGNALSAATLNTGITHYQLDFTANDVSTVIKVSFGTGTGTRTIYLDNVKMEEIKGDVKGYTAGGFNGKEMDNEVQGCGNTYDYGFRIYNARLGRFLSADPLFREYPWYTPYQFAGNKPITSIDVDGLEEFDYREIPLSDGKVMVSITAGKKVLDEAYQKVTDANGNRLWDFRYQKIQDVMDKATYGRPSVKNATTGFTMTLPYDPNTAVFSGGQSPQSPIVKNKEGESFQTNITTAYFIVDPTKDALVKNPTEFAGTSNGRGNSTLQFNVKATSGSGVFEYKNVSVGDKYTITDTDGNIIYESSFLVGEGSFNFTFTNLSSPVFNVNVESQDTDDTNSAWGFDMCVTPAPAEE